MKINNISSSTRDRWIKKPISSGAYQTWLTDNGSLTARLQQRYPDFSVMPTYLAYCGSHHCDASVLNIPPATIVLVREVQLCGNNQPVVFAHSILPGKSLRGEWRHLGHLGSKPLGAILFANQNVQRTAFAYKKMFANHVLYQAATKNLSNKPAYLWARRSVFSLKCTRIMVTEVFLPALINSEVDIAIE